MLVVVRCVQPSTGAVRVGDAGDVSEDGDAELNADPWNIDHKPVHKNRIPGQLKVQTSLGYISIDQHQGVQAVRGGGPGHGGRR